MGLKVIAVLAMERTCPGDLAAAPRRLVWFNSTRNAASPKLSKMFQVWSFSGARRHAQQDDAMTGNGARVRAESHRRRSRPDLPRLCVAQLQLLATNRRLGAPSAAADQADGLATA